MRQIAPAQIILFDQTNFPVTLPILQLLFASDCISRRFELLHVNEVKHMLFFDEFRAATAAVLIEPDPKVIGDADVKRPISAACENVDVIGACSAHYRRDLARTPAAAAMDPGFRRDDNWNKLRTL